MLGVQAPSTAASYPSLYVFGDSFVDAGNSRIGTAGEQAQPQDGYFEGRYSNGYNFADYLAHDIGAVTPVAALAGGTNFAVGGAKAQRMAGEIIPSFLGQIDYLRTTASPIIPHDALVLVAFGGNDVRDTIGFGGPADFSAASSDFAQGLSQLYGLGARNFLITGAPDVGLMPDPRVITGNNVVRLGELSERSAGAQQHLRRARRRIGRAARYQRHLFRPRRLRASAAGRSGGVRPASEPRLNHALPDPAWRLSPADELRRLGLFRPGAPDDLDA
jgi:hypothetical protein